MRLASIIRNSLSLLVTGVESLRPTLLKVYNVLGQEVATLVNEALKPGYYEAKFDASRHVGIASRMYFYRLQAGGSSLSRKMIVTK
jgi:hypothetical protein